MNASVFRNTRFEVRHIEQGPNGFRLVCSPRDVPPNLVFEDGREVLRALRTPQLEVPEEDFTDDEMRQVHATLELLERKFAVVFDRWANAPGRIIDVVNETIEAEKRLRIAKLEAARIEAENVAKRAELEELDKNLSIIRASGDTNPDAPQPSRLR